MSIRPNYLNELSDEERADLYAKVHEACVSVAVSMHLTELLRMGAPIPLKKIREAEMAQEKAIEALCVLGIMPPRRRSAPIVVLVTAPVGES